MADMKIFFATDLHGSDATFRKFLNAAQVYKPDVMILGGDMTGRQVIPFIKFANGKAAFTWQGKDITAEPDEISNYERQVRSAGAYPFFTTPDQFTQLKSNPNDLKRTFRETICYSVLQWIEMADDRLGKAGIECYFLPGNDDDLLVDETFYKAQWVKNPEGKVLILRGEYEMISTGFTNLNPWRSFRELNEDQLLEKLESMAGRLNLPSRAIFNFHCPPYKTDLDFGVLLDSNLNPIGGEGNEQGGPLGSKAVRQIIETYQPLLSLHGHVPESSGIIKMNKTVCVNPGSEAEEGALHAALVVMDSQRVKGHMLTNS